MALTVVSHSDSQPGFFNSPLRHSALRCKWVRPVRQNDFYHGFTFCLVGELRPGKTQPPNLVFGSEGQTQ